MSIATIIKNYLLAHTRSLIASLGYMWRNKFNTIITCLLLGIIISLPTGLFVLLKNCYKIPSVADPGIEINIFLDKPNDKEKILAKAKELPHADNIQKINYISAAEGIEELQRVIKQEDLLSKLNNNPLPDTLVLVLKHSVSPENALQIITAAQNWPEVDSVKADLDLLKKLQALINFGQVMLLMISVILLIAVFLVIYNTTNMIIKGQKKQIVITKLVGASDSFIRQEFLYLGFWHALFASFTTIFVLIISHYIGQKLISSITNLYDSNFQLENMAVTEFICLFFIVLSLCLVATWTAVSKRLTKLSID